MVTYVIYFQAININMFVFYDLLDIHITGVLRVCIQQNTSLSSLFIVPANINRQTVWTQESGHV